MVSEKVLFDLPGELFEQTFFLGLVVVDEENTVISSRKLLDNWIVCICGEDPDRFRTIDFILTATILIFSY